MSDSELFAEIHRLAKELGKPPSKVRFQEETGITQAEWFGRPWRNWGEVLEAAGLEKLKFDKTKFTTGEVIQRLIEVIRDIGEFPGWAELKKRKFLDDTFPSANVFKARLGGGQHSQAPIAKSIIEYCSKSGNFDDVIEVCEKIVNRSSVPEPDDEDAGQGRVIPGYVYLIKYPRGVYKVGRTENVTQRAGDLDRIAPEGCDQRWVIKTDDPVGVEEYWHDRFADKRVMIQKEDRSQHTFASTHLM